MKDEEEYDINAEATAKPETVSIKQMLDRRQSRFPKGAAAKSHLNANNNKSTSKSQISDRSRKVASNRGDGKIIDS